MKSVTLTRQAITRGELDTAILLWFLDKDPASIHTLAAASLEILHALASKRDCPSMILNSVDSAPSKTQKKVRANKINMPQNFFKHAKHDPNHVVDFVPEFSEYMMYDALRCFEAVYGARSPLMHIFAARFVFTWGPLLAPFPKGEGNVHEGFSEGEFALLGRRAFLEKGLAIFGVT